MARTVLVTGAAGFIGAALSQRLLHRGDRVVGLDSLNGILRSQPQASSASSDRSLYPDRSLAF